ncbi:MAG: hypothetical protein ACK4V6_14065 [Microthrixaceae bacterium]
MTTPPDDRPLSGVRAAALGRSTPVLATTPLGTIDAGAVGDVDGAGWVQLRGASWSLDWWIGAEDRWHHPALESAVRQHLLDDAPVVETAMRVPGGDVVHRAFGVRATSPTADGELWDDSAVLVEVENQTAVPVALAFVLRALALGGDGRIGEVVIDGATVRVDGRVAALLSRPVARVAHGAPGDVASRLAEGLDGEPVARIDRSDGQLEVALVVPLPHTATVRILLPRVAEAPRRRWFGGATPAAEPGEVFEAPAAEAIIKGWSVHSRDVARLELAEPLLDRLVPGAARSLSLAFGDHVLDRADRAVAVSELLARCGLVEPLGPLARSLVELQRLGGAVRADDDGDLTAALLFAAAPLLATGSELWEEQLIGPVAKSVHLIRKGGALEQASTWRAGADALAMVAPALLVAGQPEVAADAADAALAVAARLEGATDPTDATDSTDATDAPDPAGDSWEPVARGRTRLRAGDQQAVAALLDLARLGDASTMGDRYDAAGVPAGELGFDPGAVAARALAAIDLAVVDGPHGPVLLSGWPEQWWGRSVEAHGVHTRWGRASFGVRWHGTRPAVLWQIDAGPRVAVDGAAPVLSCPALDPSWRGEGWSGEALLGEVTPPDGLLDPPPSTPGSTTITPRVVDLPTPPSEGQSFL